MKSLQLETMVSQGGLMVRDRASPGVPRQFSSGAARDVNGTDDEGAPPLHAAPQSRYRKIADSELLQYLDLVQVLMPGIRAGAPISRCIYGAKQLRVWSLNISFLT